MDDDEIRGAASNSYGNDIGVQCCKQDGSSGYRQGLQGGVDFSSTHLSCLKAVSYDVAKAACEANGDRLCTAEEVEDDIGTGSGCSHDARHVWTSDYCTITDQQLPITPSPTQRPTTGDEICRPAFGRGVGTSLVSMVLQ